MNSFITRWTRTPLLRIIVLHLFYLSFDVVTKEASLSLEFTLVNWLHRFWEERCFGQLFVVFEISMVLIETSNILDHNWCYAFESHGFGCFTVAYDISIVLDTENVVVSFLQVLLVLLGFLS